MGNTFLKEIFNLCKKIQKNKLTERFKTSTNFPSPSSNGLNEIYHSRCNYIQFAKNINKQFYGYLLIDENIDSFKISEFDKIDHLKEDERLLFEQGHKTLVNLIELCVEDIRKKSNVFAEAINPYFISKEINLRKDVQPLLDESDYSDIVNAFKSGKVYHALYNSDFELLFDQFSLSNMKAVMKSITDEMILCYNNDIPKNISNLSLRLESKRVIPQDVLFMYSLLLYSLQESLHIACQLLFEAMSGGDLIVLDNNKIFDIDPTTGVQVCKHYKLSIQDALFAIMYNPVGKMVLIDCDVDDQTHLHEFGMIIQTSTQLFGEYGETSKISLIAIDDEANPIRYITETILRHGLPKKAPS